jgi:hypothetical protein
LAAAVPVVRGLAVAVAVAVFTSIESIQLLVTRPMTSLLVQVDWLKKHPANRTAQARAVVHH